MLLNPKKTIDRLQLVKLLKIFMWRISDGERNYVGEKERKVSGLQYIRSKEGSYYIIQQLKL